MRGRREQVDEIMNTKVGEPRSQPRPSRKRAGSRMPGGMEGKIWMSPDFDDLDEELMELIENSEIFPGDGMASAAGTHN